MNWFLYLYPIKEYVEHSISNNSYGVKKESYLKKVRTINDYIDEYRKKDYSIAYSVFPDSKIHDLFKIKDSDKIITVNSCFKEMVEDKTHPNLSDVIYSLEGLNDLVFAGFHNGDCVKKMSQKAKEIGFNSSIDRALTEFFFFLAKSHDNIYEGLRENDEWAKNYGLLN